MIRRTLLLTGVLLMVLTAPAHAQTYGGGGTPGIAVVPASPTPGNPVTVTACCFLAGSTVTFYIDEIPIGNAIANADGVASGTFTVPRSVVAGASIVAAYGILPDGTPGGQSVAVNVAAAGAGATPATIPGLGGLPVTGNGQSLPFSLVAVLLLAGGGAALLASRRRDTDVRSDSLT